MRLDSCYGEKSVVVVAAAAAAEEEDAMLTIRWRNQRGETWRCEENRDFSETTVH